MTPAAMAAIHGAAFSPGRAWSAGEISSLIKAPGGFAVTAPAGFALGRAIAGEAELITIAVDPAARGAGQGRLLLAAFEAQARARGATAGFLEVAADNPVALGLYRAAGWAETGRRRGYYARAEGTVDALTFAKQLG